MPEQPLTSLQALLEKFPHQSAIGQRVRQLYDSIRVQDRQDDINPILTLYDELIPLLEMEVWREGVDEALLELYQQMFRGMEALISWQGGDTRHSFIVVIPVADRPQHLQSCLDSLLELCDTFAYGGRTEQGYGGVSVIVADDSREQENMRRHRELAHDFSAKGLAVHYFGLAEQQQQVDELAPDAGRQLARIIGKVEPVVSHKGASLMRNIAYLKLAGLVAMDDRALCYFIDSDQEFRVNAMHGARDWNGYGINYFYHLDRIFSTGRIDVLTGKVVGDPPVSPAVMAGNFLDDVTGFLSEIQLLEPQASCQFHDHERQNADDASYHDMADLFGFSHPSEPFHYRCTLTERHDHLDCFRSFARKLNRFFDGEHPTRKSYYQYQDVAASTAPARTIYSGNYLLRPTALDYFIPFATLKLRMAGPVLGRIIKSEVGGRFVSANLPMLHKRTVTGVGQSEFRPGVDRGEQLVDLAGEFERQFFGDIMLFSVEKLAAQGYPETQVPIEMVRQVLDDTAQEMLSRYEQKHAQIMEKLYILKSLFDDQQNWWHRHPDLDQARDNFRCFIGSMEHNFGSDSPCYAQIQSQQNRSQRMQQILDAIMSYSNDRAAWRKIVLHACEGCV